MTWTTWAKTVGNLSVYKMSILLMAEGSRLLTLKDKKETGERQAHSTSTLASSVLQCFTNKLREIRTCVWRNVKMDFSLKLSGQIDCCCLGFEVFNVAECSFFSKAHVFFASKRGYLCILNLNCVSR